MQKTFLSFVFGCRVNQAEQQNINKELIGYGFKEDNNNPALIIINSCAVTQKAERETRQLLYKLRINFPLSKVVITGCSATFWQKNIKNKDLPFNFIVSNKEKHQLVSNILNEYYKIRKFKSQSQLSFFNNKYLASGRLLLKIQDGCNRFCSYCIVPYLRGKPSSVKIDDLIKQVKKFSGIKEVILTAINTEAYGVDINESFTDLIKKIIKETKVPRISFGSINPWSIDKNFIRLYSESADSDRLMHFFHVPVQSGSDKILDLMKRGYKSEEIKEKLFKISKINKLALIATDIIVGFLGETNCEFDETYSFLEKAPISKFHVFRFSARLGTAAYYMSKKISEPSYTEKKKRANILIELGKKKYSNFLYKNIGRISGGLFISKPEYSYQDCLIDNQLLVKIATNKNLLSQIKNVRITGIKNGRLVGRVA